LRSFNTYFLFHLNPTEPQANGSGSAAHPMNRQHPSPVSNAPQQPQPQPFPRQRQGARVQAPPSSLRLHAEMTSDVFPYPTQEQNHIVASNYNNNHAVSSNNNGGISSSVDSSPTMPLYEGVMEECDREGGFTFSEIGIRYIV